MSKKRSEFAGGCFSMNLTRSSAIEYLSACRFLAILIVLICQPASADWWASAEDGWCYHSESKSLCLPASFKLERITQSTLKFADRSGTNHSYFATIHSNVDQDEVVDSYVDDTFELENHDQYESIGIWRFVPSESGEYAHKIAVLIFSVERQFTIVVHGRNTSELSSLSDSILKQLQPTDNRR